MPSSTMRFPSVGCQVLSSLIHFLGLTILTHCLSRRVQHESLTWHGLSTMPWPKLCVILMFLDSWLFLFSSGVLLFGVGLEFSPPACTVAIYLNILFYSTSKFLVYAFLAEKVHIVWSPKVGIRRLESPVYLICITCVSFYCIIITFLFAGPVHELNGDGICVTGLKRIASIPLLVYDLYINVFLTFMFLYPLVSSKLKSSGLRRLAIRTFIAALVALTTSTVNVVVLMLLNGKELGWVNLGACGADIIVNAVAIFWVSMGGSRHHDSSGLPPERNRRRDNPCPNDGLDTISLAARSPSSVQQGAAVTPCASLPYFPGGQGQSTLEEVKTKRRDSWLASLFAQAQAQRQQSSVMVSDSFERHPARVELQIQMPMDSGSEFEDDLPHKSICR
ncbi:hypothetical protein K443DRAFT_133591 [Laccaria amethystina LaAM-08-1]|uniref:Transmembrane protein n=1 Tax=Laccaria amethystina LaAM-08-1 TaxID=1095629 RepID=A0A0C9XKM1_9AGAR|nr:hypothetical protein K443DRAFT_133591 [Laccaria amethystina LaAM-08-1]